MSYTVVTRQPISPGADLWSYTITGDPTTANGLKAGISSIARQTDSLPVGALWIKTGLADTAWESFAQGGAGSGSGSTSALVVTMEQYGSFAAGAADPVLDEAALAAAMLALKNAGGGTLELYANYAIATALGVVFSGDGYGNIAWKGRTPKAGFHSTADVPFGTPGDTTLVNFTGSSVFGLSTLFFDNFSMEGFSTGDYRKLFFFSNTDTVYMNRIRIKNNAVEGIYFSGSNHCRNAFVSNCNAENIGLGVQKLSAYNLNVDTMSLSESRAYNCGQGLEQQGRNFRIINNHFEQCIFAGLLLVSTWASWLDPLDGVTIHTSANGVVLGNHFIDMSTAIATGDSAGHLDHGVPVPGNGGALALNNNNFLRVTQLFTGGADLFKVIQFKHNYAEDAFDASNYGVAFLKGWLDADDNTFVLGPNSVWAGVVRAGDSDPVHTKCSIRNTKIIGKCWSTSAMVLGPNVEEIGTRFLDITPGAEKYRRLAGSSYIADGPISEWSLADAWFVADDADFIYSPWQQSKIKVIDAPPAKGTWKIGDIATNLGSGTTRGWRCITSGTADTITAGVTCSTTSGSVNFTVTAGRNFIVQNQYITIAGVTGVKKLATYNPATGVGTFGTTASATVVSGAVAYSPPVWVAVNDASTLSIASQAAGDILYAANATTWARLPKGADGTALGYSGGLPAAIDAVARFDAGNSAAAITLARTPAHTWQKLTLNTATPAVTIDDTSIPSGGYLETDIFEDGAGGRVPTFALTSAAAINWVGGVAPTKTSGGGKADRYVWHNEGARITAWVSLANF